MGYKSFCCLLLLLTGNVSLLAQGIDDISPMAIYNIGLVGCDSIGVNVLKTFISTGEARCVAVFDEKTTLAESTEREITSIQDKAPLLQNARPERFGYCTYRCIERGTRQVLFEGL